MLYGKKIVHTTYVQVVHMLYGQKLSVHTTYITCPYVVWKKWFLPNKIWTNCLYVVWKNIYICPIDKDISDDREKFHNGYTDMTYLRKRYMNIAPA